MANDKRIAFRNNSQTKIGVDAATARGAIFDYLTKRGLVGATCDELEYALAYPHQSASARVHELMKAGVIIPRGTRKTKHGRQAKVWIVAYATRVQNANGVAQWARP